MPAGSWSGRAARTTYIPPPAGITDSARIHVRFTLTNGNNEEQELVLQRREGKWEIADFIRPNSGSLLKQIEAKTAARLKQ